MVTAVKILCTRFKIARLRKRLVTCKTATAVSSIKLPRIKTPYTRNQIVIDASLAKIAAATGARKSITRKATIEVMDSKETAALINEPARGKSFSSR